MAHAIFQPAIRLWQRWQTERAIAHLDPHILKDAGIEVPKNGWDTLNILQPTYWTGQRRK